MTGAPAPVLEVQGLTMEFGGVRALEGVNCAVRQGAITALIGPNGAGKTTFFNCITGMYCPTGGEVFLVAPEGGRKRITGEKPNRITAKGMARTFQNIRLFNEMTVLENVMIGRHCRSRAGVVGAILRGASTRREERAIVEQSYGFLAKVGLAPQANVLARNLPYGAQRRLEIARALATEPFLLLLDEPAAGMNPQETRELDELIFSIREAMSLSILLIEHDMRLVMNLSDHIVVMDYGRKIAEGPPHEVRRNPAVIKAYLGEEFD